MKLSRILATSASIVSLTILTFPTAAFATNPTSHAKSTVTLTGNDVSWPQCSSTLPKSYAFGIVGVNDGTAATTNPCLAAQLTWANQANGTTSQPKIQLYVNTANPGEVIDQITTWPTSSTPDNPYGSCTGQNDLACSWQYGRNRAEEDASQRFGPAAQAAGINASASGYIWWLDVETANTWQSGSDAALARNVADLEGMTAYFESVDATVGLYSTAYQWNAIVGTQVSATSNLTSLSSWLPGATSLKGAQAKCSSAPLTANGTVKLTQYISRNVDYDYSCIG